MRARGRLAVAMLMLATGCGTRLPDSAFTAAAVRGDAADGSVGSEVAVDAVATSDADGTSVTGTIDGVDPATGSSGPGRSTSRDAGSTGSNPRAPGSGTSAGPSGGGAGSGNTSSDVGVTPTAIKLGNITTLGGPLGPVFEGPLHASRAYFAALNEQGGINGRKVTIGVCDDKGVPDRNNFCVRNLIDEQKIFAFIVTSTTTYSGAEYVNSKGVPDLSNVCCSNVISKYPHMWSVFGNPYPRDGKKIGDNGTTYSTTGSYRWFKQKLGAGRAAVFFYTIAASREAGLSSADYAAKEGIETVYYGGGSNQGINPAQPTYDTDVVQMRNSRVDITFNTIDYLGFQKLCQAMDRYAYQVKAMVGNINGMGDFVGRDFSTPCRTTIYMTGGMRSYGQKDHPEVAKYQAAMKKYAPNWPLDQFSVLGWGGSIMATEAMKAQGATLTRSGVENWLRSIKDYTQNDLVPTGVDFRVRTDWSGPLESCPGIHKWDEPAKTFLTVDATTCYMTPVYATQSGET